MSGPYLLIKLFLLWIHEFYTVFLYLHVAPSAPRDIRVRQVRPLMVEVSWRPPAMSNGIITHYTIYAKPRLSHGATRSKRQTNTSPQTITKVVWRLVYANGNFTFSLKVYPSTINSGNISLIDYSITYQFQVSASTNFGQTPNEGELSDVTANTIIFIPMPGTKASLSLLTWYKNY